MADVHGLTSYCHAAIPVCDQPRQVEAGTEYAETGAIFVERVKDLLLEDGFDDNGCFGGAGGGSNGLAAPFVIVVRVRRTVARIPGPAVMAPATQ
jgi:hypothetical protein